MFAWIRELNSLASDWQSIFRGGHRSCKNRRTILDSLRYSWYNASKPPSLSFAADLERSRNGIDSPFRAIRTSSERSDE